MTATFRRNPGIPLSLPNFRPVFFCENLLPYNAPYAKCTSSHRELLVGFVNFSATAWPSIEPPNPILQVMPLSPSRTTPDIMIHIETATSWGRGIVSGIIQYARKHQPWHLVFDPQGPEATYTPERLERCDGIIGRISDPEMARLISETGLPAVTVSSVSHPGIDLPSVVTKWDASGRTAVEHFRTRGFFNFGCVGKFDLPYVRDLFNAFEKHLGPFAENCRHFDVGDDNAELASWLKALPKPVGIFCWGPSLGRHVIDTCREEQIQIPNEVAVLGSDFDDLLSDASHPAQSGLRIPTEQIGMTAASMLDALMNGRKLEERHIQIEPRGTIRRLSTDTLAVSDRRMAQAMRYIVERFREPIMVDDILRENPMARRSLERKFRALYGCTIVEQIRNLRIREAQRLLAETDTPITLIAEESGFSSYNYLNRVFRQKTGQSPSEYRRDARNFSVSQTTRLPPEKAAGRFRKIAH